MIKQYRRMKADRQGVEFDENGFTLIELLIVIVVLGILAATVIFALGGVAGQSAQAACQTDGKSYETAVSAYMNAPLNTANTPPTLTSQLSTAGTFGGPFLANKANNPHYVVFLSGDAGAPALVQGVAPAAGHVYVGPTLTSASDDDYNSETSTTGCNAVT